MVIDANCEDLLGGRGEIATATEPDSDINLTERPGQIRNCNIVR